MNRLSLGLLICALVTILHLPSITNAADEKSTTTTPAPAPTTTTTPTPTTDACTELINATQATCCAVNDCTWAKCGDEELEEVCRSLDALKLVGAECVKKNNCSEAADIPTTPAFNTTSNNDTTTPVPINNISSTPEPENDNSTASNGTATPATPTTAPEITVNPEENTTDTNTPTTTKAPITTPTTTTVTPAPQGNGSTTAKPSECDSTGIGGQRFDAASFIGGIVLMGGIVAIIFFSLKFYKSRSENRYHQF